MKHLWQAGQRRGAFDTLSQFVQIQAKSYLDIEEGEAGEDSEIDKLLAR